jgi:hypothetical protein
MGKGCAPRKGHNQEKQSKNYDVKHQGTCKRQRSMILNALRQSPKALWLRSGFSLFRPISKGVF